MAHEQAVLIVNTLHQQLSDLARSIVNALQDRKVTPWEGMALGMKGMSLATFTLTTLQGIDDATRADLLYVLEHGTISLEG